MSESKIDIDENSAITIPLRNLIGIVLATGVAVMGYFELTQKITLLQRDLQLIEATVDLNSHFRTKWPLGELGALPDDMMQNAQLVSINEKLHEIEEIEDDIHEQRLQLNRLEAAKEVSNEKIETLFNLWNTQIAEQVE